MPKQESARSKGDGTPYVVKVSFNGLEPGEKPPDSMAFAFDATGQLLASAPVKDGKAHLALPKSANQKPVRFLFAPRAVGGEAPKFAELSRRNAYQKRFRLDLQKPGLDLAISDAIWRHWPYCACKVRGRLVKRIHLPDGSTQDLPICNARVTICEVDRIPDIILRLPDDLLRRLRDELIDIIRFPPPPPPPDPFGPFPGPLPPTPPTPPGPMERPMAARSAATSMAASQSSEVRSLPLMSQETRSQISNMMAAISITDLRNSLIDISDLIRPYICGWPWLDPYYYAVDCFTTVYVEEDGRFETTIYYDCLGDHPDLYFSAEQWHSGSWNSIYAPPVRCNTYWDYQCGEEVTIYVTDPSAVPCAPTDPVDPPPGVFTWVMPFAVGGTEIWGSPPPPMLGDPTPLPPTGGWVKPDGYTDYGGYVDAPFGGYLGFRHGFSSNIPSPGIKYYRWSYRKVGTTDWKELFIPVSRYYVKESPNELPTFPTYPLGPHTVGTKTNLYEFKPDAPPGPDAGDPAGTITYWPTDQFFGDIYTGFLDSTGLTPNALGAAGQYQLKLEVFNPAGAQVMPGGGTFRFIVPKGFDVDGVTVLARLAEAAEIDAGGFVFNLQIDNNPCDAVIDAPSIGLTAVADECGFLRYDPNDATPVTIDFHATQPYNHATFAFNMVRGATAVGIANASGEVSANPAGAYAGDGSGNFAHDFPRGDLLGACLNAAFAEHLYVYAKATNGWVRLNQYDASDLRAFALAPEED